jgi:hypothetical protein
MVDNQPDADIKSATDNNQPSLSLPSTPVSVVPVSNDYNLWTVLLLSVSPSSLTKYHPTHSDGFALSLPGLDKNISIPGNLQPGSVPSIPKYLETLNALTKRITDLREDEACARYYRPTSTAFVTFT